MDKEMFKNILVDTLKEATDYARECSQLTLEKSTKLTASLMITLIQKGILTEQELNDILDSAKGEGNE